MISPERKWVISLVVFAVVLGNVFAIKVRPLLKDATSLKKEYKQNIDRKKRYLSPDEGPPTQMLAKLIGEEKESLYNAYSAGVERLSLIKPELLSEGELQPTIYWKDTLRKKRIRLLAQARRSHVQIPEGLSFGDNIPPREEVPRLLRELKIVEEILTLAIKSGVESVSDIALDAEQLIESSGEIFLKKVRFKFSMGGNLECLVRFIHSIQEIDSFYVIEDISIEQDKNIPGVSEKLRADLILSTVYMSSNSDIEF